MVPRPQFLEKNSEKLQLAFRKTKPEYRKTSVFESEADESEEPE